MAIGARIPFPMPCSCCARRTCTRPRRVRSRRLPIRASRRRAGRSSAISRRWIRSFPIPARPTGISRSPGRGFSTDCRAKPERSVVACRRAARHRRNRRMDHRRRIRDDRASPISASAGRTRLFRHLRATQPRGPRDGRDDECRRLGGRGPLVGAGRSSSPAIAWAPPSRPISSRRCRSSWGRASRHVCSPRRGPATPPGPRSSMGQVDGLSAFQLCSRRRAASADARHGLCPAAARTALQPDDVSAGIRLDLACNHHLLCYCAMINSPAERRCRSRQGTPPRGPAFSARPRACPKRPRRSRFSSTRPMGSRKRCCRC